MNEENGNIQVIPSVPVGIGDDQLLAVAAAAEKRIEAVNKIKALSLRVTNQRDWTDQGGNPYLQVSGSEKVARLFGISWRLDEPVREDHDDGHFSYSFKGYFSMGTAEIEVMGTRSSKDPFFGGSKDRPIPPSEIDRNDVKKGAMTNCIGNGVTRLLGIRNLTWGDLESAGIRQGEVGKVKYRDSDPNAAPKIPNYGKYKGLAMDDPSIPLADLRYYLSGAEKSIVDPDKSKYKANNERMRDALKAEIAKRESDHETPEQDGAGHVGPEETGATQQARDAAPPSMPEEDDLFKQAVADYCGQFRTVGTAAQCNELYRNAPDNLKQAIYATYSKTLGSFNKKK